MQWKPSIIRRINQVLKPLGVRLQRRGGAPTLQDLFRMAPVLWRVPAHGIRIESVMDLGASDGRWSIAARRVFPEARFLAVEPLIEQKPALERVKAGWPGFDYALCAAGEPGQHQAALVVSDDLVRSTVGGNGGNARAVPVKTLDQLAVEHHLTGPFLLKFDTHGYEVPILRGATQVLRDTQIIVMEVYNFDVTEHSRRFPQMCLYLEELGFRCYDIADPMLREHDSALWQMDMFFMRKDNALFRHARYGK